MSAPTARRTQAERRAESDDRLLEAAAAIIAEEGYMAATLERVGERATLDFNLTYNPACALSPYCN